MRSPLVLAALVAAIALAAVGTVLWIGGVLRPAPTIAPGAVESAIRQGNTLALTVDAAGPQPIDRAGETVRRAAVAIASGRLAAPALVTFDVRGDRGAPLMRLAYDSGILASGAVSGGTGDHMLGLAGLGSRLPPRGDPRLVAYCGRMETMLKPFCTRARGGAPDPFRSP